MTIEIFSINSKALFNAAISLMLGLCLVSCASNPAIKIEDAKKMRASKLAIAFSYPFQAIFFEGLGGSGSSSGGGFTANVTITPGSSVYSFANKWNFDEEYESYFSNKFVGLGIQAKPVAEILSKETLKNFRALQEVGKDGLYSKLLSGGGLNPAEKKNLETQQKFNLKAPPNQELLKELEGKGYGYLLVFKVNRLDVLPNMFVGSMVKLFTSVAIIDVRSGQTVGVNEEVTQLGFHVNFKVPYTGSQSDPDVKFKNQFIEKDFSLLKLALKEGLDKTLDKKSFFIQDQLHLGSE